jgi:ArsR family transcriptional regulator
MDDLLGALRACAEPTRLRLLALAARGSFCVMDFCDILGQSQPRLSRHLRLLTEAGLLERIREGANVWLALPPSDVAAGALVRSILHHLPDNQDYQADRRRAARVQSERARQATDTFHARGADWDEMHALGLPADAVEAALLRLLPPAPVGRMLDIGTGTGRVLELLAPYISAGVGVDASRAMLALARARLARTDQAGSNPTGHCSVRLADMYRLPMPDGRFDLVVMQMVLHHAEDPNACLAESVRVLRPGGRLIVVDLVRHEDAAAMRRLGHRHPGFGDAELLAMLAEAGLRETQTETVHGPITVRLWSAERPPLAAHAAAPVALEAA